MIGAELERLLRRLIREELTRVEGAPQDSTDEEDLQRLVAERAAKMRRARGPR